MAQRPTFRLYLLGSLGDGKQPQTLVTLAEFREGRAVERVTLEPEPTKALTQRIRELAAFIEGGFPPFAEAALQQLGDDLFRLVLRNKVRDLFITATARRERFLPMEIFVEDYEIAGWPWEYLYDAMNGKFICQEFHPISRGLFTLEPGRELRRRRGKIRILFVSGVLPGDPAITPAEELKVLQEVFRSYLATDSVEIRVVSGVEPLVLNQVVNTGVFDILHFVGHAGIDLQRKEGFLRFDRPRREPARYYARELAILLAEQGVRLVFLNACESARAAGSESPARSSVAAALLEHGIPAVIGTQFSIADNSAHYLASMIYNALAAGKPLIEAMRAGRLAMTFADKPQFFDWGIPVLYAADPDLVLFPQPKARSAKWVESFEAALDSSNVVQVFTAQTVAGGPSVSVERTTRSSSSAQSKVRVALNDIDSKVGFLPDLVEAANRAQTYYHFQVVYLPTPSGAVRTDFDKSAAPPQMFLPRLEEYLGNAPRDLGVDLVCCLTRHPIAGEEDGELFWNFFASPLNNNSRVSAVSTFELRDFAREAGASFAKATLRLCLGMLLVTEGRWPVRFHEETMSCLFDYCERRADIVKGLRHMRFDHSICRQQIEDPLQLEAIDALHALEIPESL